MRRRKFEEDVVVEEETTVEETVEESPDSHEAFVSILVDMGLSAEQAEAVHSMAMDLIDAGGSEEITEEVKEEVKVEASRQRRSARSASPRRGRSEFARSERSGRRQMSEAEQKEARQDRATRRLRRQNIELRKQLRELGASPAAQPMRHAPNVKQENFSSQAPKAMSKGTSQAFDMINNFGK